MQKKWKKLDSEFSYAFENKCIYFFPLFFHKLTPPSRSIILSFQNFISEYRSTLYIYIS
jgi:hypothetical protein